MRKAASVIAALVAVLALAASAQTLYRWVDAEGKVHYGDKPPKGFKGTVTPIDAEVGKSTVPSKPAPAGPAPQAAPKSQPVEDIAAKRRATRAQLEARLAKARDNLDAARKALSENESPQDDERQIIQQRKSGGGMHGMSGARSNCRTEVGKDGSKTQMCPTAVPTPEYHDRIARLEANLKKAEEDLAEAEEAWRRGVD